MWDEYLVEVDDVPARDLASAVGDVPLLDRPKLVALQIGGWKVLLLQVGHDHYLELMVSQLDDVPAETG